MLLYIETLERKDFVQFVDKIDVFKKDNLNSFDKKHMRLAINLAKNQKNNTGQKPSVGCVIVKNRK